MQKRILSYPAIVLLCVVSSIVIHSFVIPTDFAPGGVSGIATMIQYAWGINAGILVFLINIPLCIMSIFLLGGEFTVKSILGVLTFSFSLWILDYIDFPVYEPEQSILTVVVGGVLDGFAVAFIFKLTGSLGGTDFVAAVIYKKNSQINIIWFVFAINVLIALVSIFVYKRGIEPAILSIIMTFISGKVVDSIMAGFTVASKFEIITEKPEEVKQAIYSIVERGVTIIPVKGAYSNTERHLILCIVRKREIPNMQRLLRDFECSFSIQSNVHNVYGQRFGSIKSSKSGL
ncbi:MAG: YitT family protein [Firmicutes bacterium]|nr:YitT family protein [Bacillota bacterium]MCL1953786.1 YitT family protein [Bacillota bacterium]